MKFNNKVALSALAVFVILTSACLYTVDQRYVAIEKFLGEIKLNDQKRPVIQGPGLHMKLPLLTTVLYFDTRLQTLGSQMERISTKDQKFVLVDYFVKWKIRDYYQFYLSTGGDYTRVTNLLQPSVSDALRAEFGKKQIEEVVSEDRANVMAMVKKSLIEETEESLGVSIIDMRIKRIDLPVEVRESVYDRMRTKREQVANAHRYKGQKRSEEIKSEADFNSKRIIAEAAKKAEVIRGEADAKAARIYSDTFNQDPEFYQFYRSLNAYDNVFSGGDNILVLSPDSDFFKYFSQRKVKG